MTPASTRRAVAEARPAYRRWFNHTAACPAYALGNWCHDCDATDFDADVEAHERERLRAEEALAALEGGS